MKQPVEKVQVISSFYPWRAKLERKWQHGRKICSSIVDFFNRLERLLDGKLKYNIDTVPLIEKHILRLSPHVVITHYPQEHGQGHQDHVETASAVVNAARRIGHVDWILYAEPPIQSCDFSPSLFVDITEYMDLKKRAISIHRSESTKPYMWPEMAETRARWWAVQADLDDHNHSRFYEPFVIVKGLLRRNGTTTLSGGDTFI